MTARVFFGLTLCATVLALGVTTPATIALQDTDRSTWDERVDGPLPRWPEGGNPPVDPDQPLVPYAIQLPQPELPPTSGVIDSPPEYGPTEGVLFRYSSSAWAPIVVDCVAALTGDPAHDEIAYVVVADGGQQATAASQFTAAGADLAKVQFITQPTNSIFMRDYGPQFIWQSGALAIADSQYFSLSPLDNFMPTLLADETFEVPAYAMGLNYPGGNFLVGPARSAYVTSLVIMNNWDFGTTYIEELYAAYQGIDTLHIFPRLPPDPGGQIDMWMYLVDDDTVLISEFVPGSEPSVITITDNAALYMQALGFEVFRVPAWFDGDWNYTYTNAFRVNDRILVPVLGASEDQAVLDTWQLAAGPGVEIIPIDSFSNLWLLHAIVMQVPRHVDPLPSAHLVWPDGGELLVAGVTYDVEWTASDDDGIFYVDLLYSKDGGVADWNLIAVTEADDGHYAWTVPDDESADVIVMVVARDTDGNTVEAVSAEPLEIVDRPQSRYDFAQPTGKGAWGFATSDWDAQIAGVRYPVSIELNADEYSAFASSDASGGDTDPNRYISPDPGGSDRSTHVLEFVIHETPAEILDIGIQWEGYAENCQHVELYVWDHVAAEWCDTAGEFGENRYAANFAGNRDERLDAHIRSDFGRYIDGDGKLTMLLYVDRWAYRSFHDDFDVTVTHAGCATDLGFGGPGNVVVSVCGGDLTQPGDDALFQLTGGAPDAPLFFFLGIDYGPTPVKGGTLVPVPWLLMLPLATDGAGELAFPLVGSGGPPVTLYLQVVVLDGSVYEFSNALQLEIGT